VPFCVTKWWVYIRPGAGVVHQDHQGHCGTTENVKGVEAIHNEML